MGVQASLDLVHRWGFSLGLYVRVHASIRAFLMVPKLVRTQQICTQSLTSQDLHHPVSSLPSLKSCYQAEPLPHTGLDIDSKQVLNPMLVILSSFKADDILPL